MSNVDSIRSGRMRIEHLSGSLSFKGCRHCGRLRHLPAEEDSLEEQEVERSAWERFLRIQ